MFPIVSLSSVRRAESFSDTHQMGSVALFGMYVIMKYFGKEWINWLLSWYFSIAGVGSVWKVCCVDWHGISRFVISSSLVHYISY